MKEIIPSEYKRLKKGAIPSECLGRSYMILLMHLRLHFCFADRHELFIYRPLSDKWKKSFLCDLCELCER